MKAAHVHREGIIFGREMKVLFMNGLFHQVYFLEMY